MPYTIRDFSKICGVSAFNIRYYEKRGFPQAERSESGYRQYEIEDAYRFNTFNALLAQGFSVAEAVERLEPNEREDYASALERNNRVFEEERWLLEKKIIWNRRLQEICRNLEQELRSVHEIAVPELCFLPCTRGFDLSPSLMLGQTIERWVSLLPASSYASFGRGDTFSMGLVMERALAQKHGLESETTISIPAGDYVCLLMPGDDSERETADPRLQGLSMESEWLRIFLMTDLAGYGGDLNYLLLKKT